MNGGKNWTEDWSDRSTWIFFKAILNCLGKNTRSMKNEKLNEEWREVESKSEVELKESGRMNGS